MYLMFEAAIKGELINLPPQMHVGNVCNTN